MSWQVLVQLILQYGFPLAEKMFNQWGNTNPVTPAEWAELKALAEDSARTRMLEALKRAGIDPESEAGKAFLGLVG